MNKQTSPPSSPTSQDTSPDSRSASGQIGEGSYEGTRDYQKRMDDYLEAADVDADARAARPADAAEAAELKEAEREGLSHSKAKGQ